MKNQVPQLREKESQKNNDIIHYRSAHSSTAEVPQWFIVNVFDSVSHFPIVQDASSVEEKENIVEADIAKENAAHQKCMGHVSYISGQCRHRRVGNEFKHTKICIINSLHPLSGRLKFRNTVTGKVGLVLSSKPFQRMVVPR